MSFQKKYSDSESSSSLIPLQEIVGGSTLTIRLPP